MALALKNFIFAFIILQLPLLAPVAIASSDWQTVEVPGVDHAWILNKNPNDMVTYVKKNEKTNLSFQGASLQQIASGIIGFRFLPLQTLGFKKIKVSEFKIQNQNGIYRIQLAGTYVTPDHASVSFFERQTYRGKNFSQVSYFVQNRKLSQADAEAARKTLRGFEQSLSREPASTEENAATEAVAICTECLDQELGLKDLKTQTENLKALVPAPEENCKATETLLVDPAKKSILEDLGFKNESSDPIVNIGRGSLTCIYGAAKGVYGSIRDLVTAIPTLAGWTWDGLKTAKNGIQNADYASIMDKFTAQNILEAGKKGLQITKETVSDAYDKGSKAVFDSYQEGGVTGAVATVAQAAYNSSPHRVVGRFLADIGAKVAQAIAAEWAGFKCLDAETMSQMVCEVTGYIITDIYSGSLILSGLSKSVKIAEAISAARRVLFKGGKAVEASKLAKKEIVVGEKVESLEEISKSVNEAKSTSLTLGKEAAAESNETLQSAENIANRMPKSSRLKTDVLREALDDAEKNGDSEALRTLKKAYQSLEEARGDDAKFSKMSLKKWESKIKKDNPELTDREISRARECLISGGQ